ncbi:MAG: YegS/Rv2252/BmrU family lipid kinase [Prevotellaceae bacterium]|nr:YegS/Rv2252/BmrU family lipid kinase [Prevotellaceae bacterium]
MADKKKIRFIINPISGNGKKKGLTSLIAKTLDLDKFECSICYTEYGGHASKLAKEAAEEGIDIVVAVGGDGTVNEVARSIVHTDTAIAIVPYGSGNGLARHLRIPINARKSIQIINECEIHKLDYGKINGIPFFCTCGMGFDALVSRKFADAGKRGAASYVESAFNEVVKYKPETYEIEDETGKMSYKAFLITCANASQWGNNAFIAPHASMSDGQMDVIIVEPFNAIDVPEMWLQLYSKSIDRNSKIKTFRSRKIHIRRSMPGVIHFDGDPTMTSQDVTVEMIPKGINVVVNPNKHPTDDNDTERTAFDAVTDFINGIYDVRDDLRKGSKQLLKKLGM